MYLAELDIKGFRRVAELKLRFKPGLNVLVGPNNVGKTAVVDGLRALLTTSEEGALRVDAYDLHSSAGSTATEITFHYVFRNLTPDEEADFLPALKPILVIPDKVGQYEAHLWVRYSPTGTSSRMRPKRWCGDHEENSITSEMLEDLRAVYLPPLRDPASGLKPSRTSQLARLIDRLASDAEKGDLVKLLKDFEEKLEVEAPVANTQQAIEKRHVAMLGDTLKQALKVGLTPPEFHRLAARLSLAVEGLDIEQNGLGYNNLIYMAVVLSELALNPDAAYKALIVEEPEAHLHPQLQVVLLDHLQAIEEPVTEQKPVQVFVTSHSPHFASAAKLDSLVCLHQGDGKIGAFFPREATFAPKKKEKLQRYLDVTRADLLFARRLLLVEGAAERFLVGAMATKIGIKLREHSVTILSTEGLNFDCFAPLFGPAAIPIRVAILTDADAPTYPALADPPALSAAAAAIATLENAYIKPYFAKRTLEYDLALHPENHAHMLNALVEIHPIIAADLKLKVEAAAPADKPRELFRGMFDRGPGVTYVKKGEFAQSLANIIADPTIAFTTPPYIADALAYVTAP
jgi:putative ATP-dependent endonuclease of OLD family